MLGCSKVVRSLQYRGLRFESFESLIYRVLNEKSVRGLERMEIWGVEVSEVLNFEG